MASWVPIQENSDFSLQNLPYCVFSINESKPAIGVAIGEYVLDLKFLAQKQIFSSIEFNTRTLEESTLNSYAGLPQDVHRKIRHILQDLLRLDTPLGDVLRDNPVLRARALVSLNKIQMYLPMAIGDYTDFFVGPYHAQNCFEILRPGSTTPPNFFSLPLAYHGRASSVVISGAPVQRPKGQFIVDGTPKFGLCEKLDFEVEFAAFIGRGNEIGKSIDVDEAESHIFGLVLMNDWSARDIQQWESTPLGPFNGKNFCTTISPFVVPLEALEPFRTASLRSGPILPYLNQDKKDSVYDIPIRVSLDVSLASYEVTQCNTKSVVFSFAQMLAHHTVGGCPMRTGDLIATGTLSGSTRNELGCLLEVTKNGADPYEMRATGQENVKLSRTFLEDGDTITFTAQARGKEGVGNVGFGCCKGKIIASI